MSGPTQTDRHHERRWRILAVIAVAQLMVVLDVTIVNIALPSAQADLGFDPDSRQWVITAYALAFGSLLLLGGKISDLIGRKWTFVAGLAGFAGASAIGGAAPSFEVLVGARALQGAFAALLAPAALSIVTTTFTDPGERGKAFGIYGALATAGAAVGLLLGGFLTELLTWRWTMYVNLAFAIPAAIGAARLLVNMRPAERPRVDVPGVLVATSGLFALVYGFSSAEMDGWTAPMTIGMLAYGVVAAGVFVAIERRVASPLLPLRVVSDRNRGAAFLAVSVAGVAMFATFLFLTYYLQQGLGFSPIQSGLAFLPLVLAIFATAPATATKLLPRVGPRPLVPTGMAIAALGVVYLTRIGVESSYAGAVLPAVIVMGVGFGLIMAPSFATATHGIEPGDAGVASAMVNTSQQVGGSLGLALLSTLYADAVSGYTAEAGTPVALAQAEAAVHGYTTAFWWAAGILAAGAIATRLLFERGHRTAPAHGPAAAVSETS
ncbi:MAG TPA: MFS transporter [Streptosporangiaceae bacterium]|jgi:EmrB/QacA subfamily drug resistance transporter|nr:MFS transporter [Streptosporangiaceae bacterium]